MARKCFMGLCMMGLILMISGTSYAGLSSYTVQRALDHTESIKRSPYVAPTASGGDSFVFGQSSGWPNNPQIPQHDLYGYQITDFIVSGEKSKIVLASGNHNFEHAGSWGLQGAVDFILSDDPRAAELRQLAIFYVYPMVNPDGRYTLTGRTNPEMEAAGITDHNRGWHTSGVSTTVDSFTKAMRTDTGGQADYLLDFHSGGFNRETFYNIAAEFAGSPYANALRYRGINASTSSAREWLLRTWGMRELGALPLTPELDNRERTNMTDERAMEIGKTYILALHDVLTGSVTHFDPTVFVTNELEPLEPNLPSAGWLFDGNAREITNNELPKHVQNIQWSDDTVFDYLGNQSLSLDGISAQINLGQPTVMNTEAITVAFWVKPENIASGFQYMVSRWDINNNNRSWHIVLNDGILQISVSPDGRFNKKKIYRSSWQLPQDVWQHIAITFADDTLKLFIEGIELTRDNELLRIFDDDAVPSLISPDAPIIVGDQSTSAHRPFAGKFDELSMWNYALSPEEILWLSLNSIHEIIDN